MPYNPFIIIPPLTTCETANLVFGQGTPPYTVFPIASGDSNGTSLEAIPLQTDAGVLEWRVDFNQGANLTFVLIDAEDRTAFSDFRVVQAQFGNGITTCSKTVYVASSRSKTNVGGIVGGLVGALAVMALIIVLYFWRRHRQGHTSPFKSKSSRASHSPITSPEDMRSEERAGVVRAGTFNLHNVEFTEPSMEQLRQHDPPPGYASPPPPLPPPRRRRPSRDELSVSQSSGEGSVVSGEGLHERRLGQNGGDRAAEDRVGVDAVDARAAVDDRD